MKLIISEKDFKLFRPKWEKAGKVWDKIASHLSDEPRQKFLQFLDYKFPNGVSACNLARFIQNNTKECYREAGLDANGESLAEARSLIYRGHIVRDFIVCTVHETVGAFNERYGLDRYDARRLTFKDFSDITPLEFAGFFDAWLFDNSKDENSVYLPGIKLVRNWMAQEGEKLIRECVEDTAEDVISERI